MDHGVTNGTFADLETAEVVDGLSYVIFEYPEQPILGDVFDGLRPYFMGDIGAKYFLT